MDFDSAGFDSPNVNPGLLSLDLDSPKVNPDLLSLDLDSPNVNVDLDSAGLVSLKLNDGLVSVGLESPKEKAAGLASASLESPKLNAGFVSTDLDSTKLNAGLDSDTTLDSPKRNAGLASEGLDSPNEKVGFASFVFASPKEKAGLDSVDLSEGLFSGFSSGLAVPKLKAGFGVSVEEFDAPNENEGTEGFSDVFAVPNAKEGLSVEEGLNDGAAGFNAVVADGSCAERSESGVLTELPAVAEAFSKGLLGVDADDSETFTGAPKSKAALMSSALSLRSLSC